MKPHLLGRNEYSARPRTSDWLCVSLGAILQLAQSGAKRDASLWHYAAVLVMPEDKDMLTATSSHACCTSVYNGRVLSISESQRFIETLQPFLNETPWLVLVPPWWNSAFDMLDVSGATAHDICNIIIQQSTEK
ncbi:hypothetical protein N1851_006505 [Merluccius polli]|uniref:Uncharacterized protein n=1 Tax=Merluccius polli TaxID=89951 RepID=A0AA47N5L5_MERPO|nr:hypothetical protein N1851_006505 [Merluccius polli]